MSSAQLVGDPAASRIGHNSNGYPSAPETAGSVLLGAISRYRALVIVCTVLLAGAGAALGFRRAPIYSSSSTLQVGKVNPDSPGFYGFVQSATDLATAFSRSIAAEPVITAVNRRLGIEPEQALSRLSAEPIPNSPIFRVIATGSSTRQAIDLANVASAAVVAYVNQANTANSGSESLLGRYHAASVKLARASTGAAAAARAFKSHPNRTTYDALVSAQALVSAEKLRAQAIATNYQVSAQSTTSTNLVSLLAGASRASSDRTSKIELFAFTGLLSGLVIGCLMAAGLARRRRSKVAAA